MILLAAASAILLALLALWVAFVDIPRQNKRIADEDAREAAARYRQERVAAGWID